MTGTHKHFGQLDSSPHEHDATDLNGIIPYSNLESRLAPTGDTGSLVTDWNDAVINGWRSGQDAANAPAAGWITGRVISHDTLYVEQVVRETVAESEDGSDSKTWRRIRKGGLWGAWRRVYQTGPELDARYSVPTGAIMQWPTNTPPTGWYLLDGQAVSRTGATAGLYTLFSTTYGAGNGSSTFNLPNTKGKVVVGRDAAQSEFDALGETGGAKTHTLTTAEMPTHSHGLTQVYTAPGGTGVAGVTYTSTSDTTGPAGGGGAHNNLQPYLVLNYIIKA